LGKNAGTWGFKSDLRGGDGKLRRFKVNHVEGARIWDWRNDVESIEHLGCPFFCWNFNDNELQ
jgi:hypothetical protein